MQQQNAHKYQNQAYEQSKQPKKNKYTKIIFIFLAVLAVLLVIASAVQQFIPIEEPPVQENTWQGLTPGFKLTPKLLEELGKPLEVENLPAEKQHLTYSSEHFAAYHNEILVNKEGIVEFIQIPAKFDENNTLSNYITLYGEPDFELFAPQVNENVKAHVFLDEGLVIVANISNKVINQTWHFEPTDTETFMLNWGRQLSTEATQPEAFPR